MSEREKNENSEGVFRASVFREQELRFASFIFAAPLAALLALRIIGIQTSLFAVLFFIGGSGLEFLLLLFFWSSYKQSKINRAQLRRYVYLVYTALGLPFTIYLAQSPSYNVVALVRFLAVLSFLFPLVKRNALKLHVFFFFCGLLIYQFLQTDRAFFYRDQGVLLVFYIIALCLFWYREAWAALLQKKNFYNQLHKRRWERKYKRQAVFLSRSLQALGYSPQDSKQIEKYSKDNYQRTGNYLIFAFFFSGMHEALWDFQKKPDHSHSTALREFQREWEIFSDHIRQKLSALQLDLAIGTDHLIAGKLLCPYPPEPQARALPQELQLSLAHRKRIFQIFFAVHEFLDFSARTRRSLEQRSYTGWYLNLLMALGPAVCMQNSPSNPALVFRGPLIKRLHRGLDLIESQGWSSHSNLIADRIWIEARLQKLYEKRFEMSTALVCGAWKSPEFLLSEYTSDRSRLSPNQNFWASLEDGDLRV